MTLEGLATHYGDSGPETYSGPGTLSGDAENQQDASFSGDLQRALSVTRMVEVAEKAVLTGSQLRRTAVAERLIRME